jgi:hypothetical protein
MHACLNVIKLGCCNNYATRTLSLTVYCDMMTDEDSHCLVPTQETIFRGNELRRNNKYIFGSRNFHSDLYFKFIITLFNKRQSQCYKHGLTVRPMYEYIQFEVPFQNCIIKDCERRQSFIKYLLINNNTPDTDWWYDVRVLFFSGLLIISAAQAIHFQTVLNACKLWTDRMCKCDIVTSFKAFLSIHFWVEGKGM